MMTCLKNICGLGLLCVTAHFGFLEARAAADLVIGDFKGSSYGAWKA